MTTQQDVLWKKLQTFRFDEPGVALTFTARLARENGWSRAYARRVVTEYRKFLLLCCLTETGVTPSDAVDQAWHLHLNYTRSYWIDLCRTTLGRDIHHTPTQGGRQEAGKFNGFYSDTHRLYRDTFGTEPPADIWPDARTRFTSTRFQRVNRGRYWVLPKPSIQLSRGLTLVGLLLTALLFVQASSRMLVVALLVIVAFGGLIWLLGSLANSNTNPDQRRQQADEGSGVILLSGDADHHSHDATDGHDGADAGADSGCSASGCSGCGGGD
ncbi:glycine-rich domain-containing protein [Spirosoma sordidisoli]|uniref:glycine-rich domain-containing protein n=1 Tax=Spirosoma sordidisoli TaxID=2502893 RepID=UPI0019CF58D9|nr:hypothetical protein [Spirosoma sordidisoli]